MWGVIENLPTVSPTEMFRGGMGGNIDREFGRSDMALNRGFGDSFGRMGMMTLGKFCFPQN